MDQQPIEISILTSEFETSNSQEMRGVIQTLRNRLALTPISRDTLSESALRFFEGISTILTKMEQQLPDYELTELEVSATITTEGKLTIVAAEVAGGLEGGLKFKFCRRKTESIPKVVDKPE